MLEALSSTQLNLLLNVGFNQEVGGNAVYYWNKQDGNLADLIDKVDGLNREELKRYNRLSTQRIKDAYSWDFIANQYEKLWKNKIL